MRSGASSVGKEGRKPVSVLNLVALEHDTSLVFGPFLIKLGVLVDNEVKETANVKLTWVLGILGLQDHLIQLTGMFHVPGSLFKQLGPLCVKSFLCFLGWLEPVSW